LSKKIKNICNFIATFFLYNPDLYLGENYDIKILGNKMDIANRIKPLVEEIAFKSVEIDEPLYTSNLIDSMGTVDLAMMLEDEFGIKIDTRDIIESNFDSISKLVNYIKSRIGE
jgi:acyl carrier protein